MKDNLAETAAINESDTFEPKPRRAPRIIGITEQRLRARNRQSWMMSAKEWSTFFGRWTGFAKDSAQRK